MSEAHGDKFSQGFFCALAILADDHGEPGMAADIIRCCGMGKHINAIDPYDKKKLKDVIKELKRKP